ncbi:hypothetical protein WME97_45380 [Sorangium sp. So ce367]|uniref:hypothetical protein n=1 Tax=Sorangium sp. So ce367 TaxID=3133305 RepID=UPI003F610914
MSTRHRRRSGYDIRSMLHHTPALTYVHIATHDLPLRLSLDLWLVDGELNGGLWLFCDRHLCEPCVGKA